MNCCNYMQYRHHQTYYGTQYYEHLSPYHGEFYGQQMYPDYYGNTSYYPQHWQCATSSFSDYVYNPIEARIRKAMREAKRDRLIGASPMLPRPSARRVSHGWVGAPEELRMSPMSSMRGGLESPVCFPISTGTGSNQFMSPMNSYNKLESTIPNHNTMHNGYNMQPNPLDQLQQQTEMWSNYPDGIRPRSSGSNSFMMQDVPYTQPQQPVLQSPLIMEQQQQQQLQTHSAVNSSNNSICMTPPHSNENVPPDEANEKVITTDTTASPATDTNSDTFETKHTLEIVQPLMENNNIQQQQHHQIIDTTTTTNSSSAYIPLYDQQNVTGQQFVGKTDDMNMKKLTMSQNHSNSRKSINSKPLPDFNEAFGSTERGRFQSPPDPRLAPNKGYLDYFFDNTPMKFDDYQI